MEGAGTGTASTGGASTEGMHDKADFAAGAASGAASGATGAKTTDVNLGDELRVFGKQIESLFDSARNSPRGKEIQQQLTSAWRDVEKGVNSKINSAQATDIKGTVSGTAQYAADEVQNGMARGLHSLNTWMSQRMAESEARRKKKDEQAARDATGGKADDEVKDRFGSDETGFGEGFQVPPMPTPGNDNPIGDRYE